MKKKKMNDMKIKNHQQICNSLHSRLNQKHYYDEVTINVNYSLGETDVLAKTPTHEIYYEVKSKNTYRAFCKALDQLCRWTKFRHEQNPNKNYYGAYYTSDYMELIAKNGKLRHNYSSLESNKYRGI